MKYFNSEFFMKNFEIVSLAILKIIAIIVIAYIVTRITSYIFSKLVYSIQKSKNNSEQRTKTIIAIINNLIKYAFGITAFIFILIFAFGIPWEGLVASVGILGIIIGIGAQELIGDTVNGFFVLFEGTYDIGEYIQVGSYEGYVVELGIKSTVLSTFENKRITIPNSKVQEVINYSKNSYKFLYSFPTAYEESIETIESLINEQLIPGINQIEEVIAVEYLGINEFKSSSIDYTLEIETHPESRFRAKRKVNGLIKEKFDHHNLEIPYDNITISYKKEEINA